MQQQIKEIQFQADYLVPVQGLQVNTAFLSTYNNGVRWVNLWAVSADDNKSIADCIDADLQGYTDAIARNTDETKLAKLRHGQAIMSRLAEQVRDQIWHKRPEEILVRQVKADFARANLRADVDKAIYLEGITYMR